MALTTDNNRDIVRRLTRGESIRAIAAALGCGISTVQRLKKKLGIHPTIMNTPSTQMNTPTVKKNTVTMTCEEYAAHKGEEYSVFKHGAGILREVEV